MKTYDKLTSPDELAKASPEISSIGELALIERLKRFCAEGAIGDDAAVLKIDSQFRLVVTTDMLVEDVHFSVKTTPPYSVGWRAAAANLVDIAAMGAIPEGITVGLGLPGDTRLSWVEALYEGMADCLHTYSSEIFGGDLCRSTQRTLSITAFGRVLPEQVISRSTAVPGMTVVVTGPHGASRAGLALLLEELELPVDALPTAISNHAKDWIAAHQLPLPRFDALAALRQLIEQEAGDTYPTLSGMDSSDGLANALLQISSSSGVGMDLVTEQIPLPAGLSDAVGTETALNWALYGGEDFELVLCLPPELARKFVRTPFAMAIGVTTDSGVVNLRSQADDTHRTRLRNESSFIHF